MSRLAACVFKQTTVGSMYKFTADEDGADMEVYAFCAFKSQRPQAVVFAECYVAEHDDGLVLAFADAGGQFALSLAHGLCEGSFLHC